MILLNSQILSCTFSAIYAPKTYAPKQYTRQFFPFFPEFLDLLACTYFAESATKRVGGRGGWKLIQDNDCRGCVGWRPATWRAMEVGSSMCLQTCLLWVLLMVSLCNLYIAVACRTLVLRSLLIHDDRACESFPPWSGACSQFTLFYLWKFRLAYTMSIVLGLGTHFI